MKKVKYILILLLFLVSFIAVSNIKNRLEWQKRFDKTFFVIDFDKRICKDIGIEYFIEKINSIGIKTVILRWDEDFLTNFEYFRKNNFNVIIKLCPTERYNFFEIKNFVSTNLGFVKSIIIEPLDYKSNNSKLYKIGLDFLLKEVADIIKVKNLWCINFEFSEFSISKIFNIKDKYIRGFVLDFNLARKDYILKTRKAIKERSCKIIYLAMSEYMSLEENFVMVKEIINDNKNFITVDLDLEKYKAISFNNYTNIFIILFYVSSILFCYKKFSKNIRFAELSYLLMNLFVILSGVIIYGLLQDYDYIMLHREIFGIRMMFILPIIFMPFIIFKRSEIRSFLNYNLKIRDLIFFIFIVFGLYYVILRLGNVSRNLVFTIELQIRNFIENIILFRPRFKEIFFGQPLLIFSLKILKEGRDNVIGKIFLWCSVIAPVSILNTFLHIHTPIHISLLRTFIGAIIGLILGEILFFCWNKFISYFRNE